jgi:hypothetical protein
MNGETHRTNGWIRRATVVLTLSFSLHCKGNAVRAPPRPLSMPTTRVQYCLAALEASAPQLPSDYRKWRVPPSLPLEGKRFLFRGPVWSVMVNYAPIIAYLQRVTDDPKKAVGYAREVDFVSWARRVVTTNDIVVVDPAIVPLRFEHLIAEQFEIGTFEVIHNATGERIRAVIIEEFYFHCGPTCGGEGLVYYLPDCKEFYIKDLRAF